MRELVIDCATEACSVALFEDGELVSGEFSMLGRGHAERLVPMISSLPDQGRADRIAVAVGPGSFTGVRVGLAAAKALAFAWQAELRGYPTLDLVAARALDQTGSESVTVAMKGGHGEWFTQQFGISGSSRDPLGSLPPADAVPRSSDDLVAGSEAQAFVDLRGWGTPLPIWPDAREYALLPAASLLQQAEPIYGREPDARLPGGQR